MSSTFGTVWAAAMLIVAVIVSLFCYDVWPRVSAAQAAALLLLFLLAWAAAVFVLLDQSQQHDKRGNGDDR